jgi:AcrR family transcriptional regulator
LSRSLRAPGADDAEPDAERERIYEALVSLVAKHGLAAVDIEAILRVADVDRQTFDRHFSSLQDCFDRVWEEMTAEYTAGLNAAFEGDGPWRDRIRAAAYFTLRYFSEDATRATFFIVRAQAGGEIAQARRDRMIARGIEMVDEARSELPDPDSVPRSEAEAVLGAIYEASLGAVRSGKLEQAAEWVPQLMYIAVLPYHGPEAAQEELRRGPEDFARYRSGDL